ncbi:MAG: ABC transporter ATP-binding protein/permease [Cyanobacteria bacterium SZAS LIN-2]|nr:ABC transporter ATP-binding protein/permease [Cyanobacteria bacterium SZAS LIN-2]
MNQNTSIFSLGLWRSVWRISKPFFTSGDPWFQAYGVRSDLSDAGKKRLKGFNKLTALWAIAPLLVFLAVFAVGGIFTGLGIIAHDWSFVPEAVHAFFSGIGHFIMDSILGSAPVGWLKQVWLTGLLALSGGLATTYLVLVFKRRLISLGVLAAAFAAVVPFMPQALAYVPATIPSGYVIGSILAVSAALLAAFRQRNWVIAVAALGVSLFFLPTVVAFVPAIGGVNTGFAALSAFLNANYVTILEAFGALGVLSFAFSFTPGAMVVEKITYTEKWKAWGFMALLAFFLLSVNMMNVGINTVAGAFQDALQAKDEATYWTNLFSYGGIFLIATPVVVFFSWIKSMLVIVWRKWFTRYMLERYFLGNNSYRLSSNQLVDNPDERIANDVEGFTGGALSLVLTLVDSVITFISFFTILWIISPKLVSVVFVYAIIGTLISVMLSFKMIRLSYTQKRLDADYRYNLVRIRDNVESIAFYNGAEAEKKQVLTRLDAAIANNVQMITYSRNVSMFQTAFNYMVVIIPAIFIAPLFFAGQVKFGAFTQANLAFNQVLSSLGLFVSELGTISAFAAYVSRLSGFMDALSSKDMYESEGQTAIAMVVADKIALDHVTLFTPEGSKKLLDDVTLEVPRGKGLIIKGKSGAGKSSTLRGFGGLWRLGSGTITRPELNKVMFLSQKPYMILGSLRQQLLYPGIHAEAPESAQQQALLQSMRTDISDDFLRQCLEEANFPEIATRYPEGLDAVRNWEMELSGGEKQRLVFARLLVHKPEFVFLDEVTSALDEDSEAKLYAHLNAIGSTYVSVGHRSTLDKFHSQVLVLTGGGKWTLSHIGGNER